MDQRPFTINSFEQFLGEKRLMGSKCQKCNALLCPPRPICTRCQSESMEWIEFKGKGNLVAFTVIHAPAKVMANEGYNAKNPYCSGVVQLEEGPMISGQITGVDASQPETIRIGSEVRADFLEKGTWHIVSEIAQQRKPHLCFSVLPSG